MKKNNEYAMCLDPEFYRNCPKSVFAAIAVSFASMGGNDFKNITEKIYEEWDVLNLAGIVPQKAKLK